MHESEEVLCQVLIGASQLYYLNPQYVNVHAAMRLAGRLPENTDHLRAPAPTLPFGHNAAFEIMHVHFVCGLIQRAITESMNSTLSEHITAHHEPPVPQQWR